MTPAAADTAPAADPDASLRQLGVSQADIDRQRRTDTPADETFVPWAWHVDAMRLFGGMRTQWHATAAVGGLVYIGLNYAGLAAVEERLGLAGRGQELFDQLQAIERGAIAYLNSRLTKTA